MDKEENETPTPVSKLSEFLGEWKREQAREGEKEQEIDYEYEKNTLAAISNLVR